MTATTPAHPPARFAIRPWMIVLGLCLLYLLAVFLANRADPLVFVTLGTRFTENDPAGTEGYDGQFTYFIAADPFTAPALIDIPAYRYQRILLPALARVFALGSPMLVPWTLLVINLLALIGGTIFLERLLAREGVSRWYALTYGLFVGVFISVRLSLNEPLAYGLVLAAIWLERQYGGIGRAAVALALAALAKETALFFAAGYVLWLLLERRRAAAFAFGLLAVGPFAVWQGVLYYHFGQWGAGSGGAMATPFELIPYNGFWRIYTDTGEVRVFLILALLILPSTILPSLWGLWRSLRDLWHRRWHPYVFLLLANAAIMPFVPFSTYREPLGILRFIVGLVICVVLYGALRREQRVLRYSMLWIVLLLVALTSG